MRDPAAAKKHEIVIDNEVCIVHSHKIKKTWTAYGSYHGKHIAQTGDSESQAISNWRKIAEYHASE